MLHKRQEREPSCPKCGHRKLGWSGAEFQVSEDGKSVSIGVTCFVCSEEEPNSYEIVLEHTGQPYSTIQMKVVEWLV